MSSPLGPQARLLELLLFLVQLTGETQLGTEEKAEQEQRVIAGKPDPSSSSLTSPGQDPPSTSQPIGGAEPEGRQNAGWAEHVSGRVKSEDAPEAGTSGVA